MQCMRPLPAVVGRNRQEAQGAAEPIVALTGGEERAVSAIVLDDEKPDEEATGQHGEGQDEGELRWLFRRRRQGFPVERLST